MFSFQARLRTATVVRFKCLAMFAALSPEFANSRNKLSSSADQRNPFSARHWSRYFRGRHMHCLSHQRLKQNRPVAWGGFSSGLRLHFVAFLHF